MSVSLKELIDQGILTTPITLYGDFHGHQIEARLNGDGLLTASGQTFNSLSVAAGSLITAKTGRISSGRSYYACNGWKFWNIRDAQGVLHPLSAIRNQSD